MFRFAAAPLVLQDGQNTVLGELQLATALDADYAAELSALSGAGTVIVSHGAVVASTLPPAATRGLTPTELAVLGSNDDSLMLDGEHYAVKLLFRHGSAAVYALDSIDASAAPLLARLRFGRRCSSRSARSRSSAIASLWLARTVARPIDTLSRSLTAMTQSHDFGTPIAPTGSSLEVDALTATFNTMMASVIAAQADTRSAYVGAIRALALALDARDPYTAGHSERVSAISVAIGHQMHLPGGRARHPAPRGAAARHRQDWHQRRRPAQARGR